MEKTREQTNTQHLKRTDSTHPDFISLVRLLDADLAKRNGEDNDFYAQFNKIDLIKHVVVFYKHDEAVGCGAFKEYNPQSVEIKRMYVRPEFRGQQIGAQILKALEQWAAELNYSACVLETGKTNPEAIRLYQREGYTLIPNYGQYIGVANSLCMKREIQ